MVLSSVPAAGMPGPQSKMFVSRCSIHAQIAKIARVPFSLQPRTPSVYMVDSTSIRERRSMSRHSGNRSPGSYIGIKHSRVGWEYQAVIPDVDEKELNHVHKSQASATTTDQVGFCIWPGLRQMELAPHRNGMPSMSRKQVEAYLSKAQALEYFQPGMLVRFRHPISGLRASGCIDKCEMDDHGRLQKVRIFRGALEPAVHGNRALPLSSFDVNIDSVRGHYSEELALECLRVCDWNEEEALRRITTFGFDPEKDLWSRDAFAKVVETLQVGEGRELTREGEAGDGLLLLHKEMDPLLVRRAVRLYYEYYYPDQFQAARESLLPRRHAALIPNQSHESENGRAGRKRAREFERRERQPPDAEKTHEEFIKLLEGAAPVHSVCVLVLPTLPCDCHSRLDTFGSIR